MRIIHKAIFFLVIATCTMTVQAQNFDKAKLDSYFQALNENNKFMGSVSVFHNGNEIYSCAVGFADVDKQIANRELSKYCIGSISKMFTAVMIFQTIETGKLSLNQTINKYFPSIKNAEMITIADLLSHRSGIHNFTESGDFTKWPAKSKEQMIDIISAGGSDFEPDTHADYSNSNYVLLSYILESIYKKPYVDILIEKIIRPLFLNNTYFGKSTIDINNNESNSYSYSDKWQIQSVTNPSVTLGAGCIISNPKDLNRFANALFNGKLISESSLSTMLNIRDDYGMGIFPVPYFSQLGYGHRGGVDGFNSMLIYMPDDKISYAITSNGLNYNFTEIHIAVLNWIYGQQFDIPYLDKPTAHVTTPTEYTGRYKSSQFPLAVTVTSNGNALSIEAEGQPTIPLKADSEHVFRFIENDLTIVFNPVNSTMILIQGEGVFYFKKE